MVPPTRLLSPFCIIVLVLGLFVGTAVAVDEPVDGHLLIELDTNGDADVVFTDEFDLTDDEQHAVFEDVQEDEELRAAAASRLQEGMQSVSDEANEEIDREIQVGEVTIETSVNDETGIVAFRFRWENLAIVESNRIVLLEPFSTFDSVERELIVYAPEGYELTEVAPEPEQRGEGFVSWPGLTPYGEDFEVVATRAVEPTPESVENLTPEFVEGLTAYSGSIAFGISALLIITLLSYMNNVRQLKTRFREYPHLWLAPLSIVYIISFTIGIGGLDIFLWGWLVVSIVSPAIIYTDLRRIKKAVWEPNLRGSLWVIGSILPLVSPAVWITYLFRRYEMTQKDGAWDKWPIVVVASILTIGMAIIFLGESTNENTLITDFGVLILFATTLLPGLSTYFDLRYLKSIDEYDVPWSNWLWILGLTMWFAQFIIIFGWLVWRINISSVSKESVLATLSDIRSDKDGKRSKESVRPAIREIDPKTKPADRVTRTSSYIDELQKDAELAVEEGQIAEANGLFEEAVEKYSEARDQFKKASEIAKNSDDANSQGFTEELGTVQQNLETVTNLHEQRTTLHDTLQLAERSFQEAIAGYANENQTLSKIRFRQARDEFEKAYKLVKDDALLLSTPIRTTAEPQQKLLISEFADLPQLSDEAIESLRTAEVQDGSFELDSMTPKMVDSLTERDGITEEEATLLRILSWWGSEESIEFDTLDAIDLRFDQASNGYRASIK